MLISNSFGLTVKAKNFLSIDTFEDLSELHSIKDSTILILGACTNVILNKDIDKTIVQVNFKDITMYEDYLSVGGGVDWADFIEYCLNNNLYGIENLTHIPGSVGAAPVQNIGAYGVEVKDCITKVEALEIATNKLVSFSNEACNFGYRNSIFKNEVKGKYILTSVSFRLTTKNHQLTTSYGAIENELAVQKIKIPTLKNISDAIIRIRKSKLPDPKEIGNSGSFFKNPVISKKQFLRLQKENPSIPNYPVSETEIKVPAGWLVEQSGFKGKRFGDAGVHEKQALVLVNYGSATGIEIFQLAEKIQQTVFKKFKIALEIEVNVVAS